MKRDSRYHRMNKRRWELIVVDCRESVACTHLVGRHQIEFKNRQSFPPHTKYNVFIYSYVQFGPARFLIPTPPIHISLVNLIMDHEKLHTTTWSLRFMVHSLTFHIIFRSTTNNYSGHLRMADWLPPAAAVAAGTVGYLFSCTEEDWPFLLVWLSSWCGCMQHTPGLVLHRVGVRVDNIIIHIKQGWNADLVRPASLVRHTIHFYPSRRSIPFPIMVPRHALLHPRLGSTSKIPSCFVVMCCVLVLCCASCFVGIVYCIVSKDVTFFGHQKRLTFPIHDNTRTSFYLPHLHPKIEHNRFCVHVSASFRIRNELP